LSKNGTEEGKSIMKIHILGGPGSDTNPYLGVKILFNFLKDTHRYYVGKVSADAPKAKLMCLYFEEHGETIIPHDAEVLLMRLEKYKAAFPFGAEFTRLYLAKYKEKVFVVKNIVDHKRLFELLAIG